MSGTESKVAIQPTMNWREKGFTTYTRSRNSGMNRSMSKFSCGIDGNIRISYEGSGRESALWCGVARRGSGGRRFIDYTVVRTASVTTSFISRSRSCMPLWTCVSVSADNLKRPSNMSLKCITHEARATLAMLYRASQP